MREQIIPEDHCFLCQNRVFDPHRGQVCSITSGKREIRRKCPDFFFRDDLDIIERDLHEKLNQPRHQRNNAIGGLIKWVIIGAGLLVLEYWLSV